MFQDLCCSAEALDHSAIFSSRCKKIAPEELYDPQTGSKFCCTYTCEFFGCPFDQPELSEDGILMS